MIKRSHVRQFLALVDEGSFTAAASRIGVTQPTLSSGIAELERLVGKPLFVRDRKRVRMTDAGGRLLPIARALEQNFRAADNLRLTEPQQWPTLKLGLLRTVAGPVAQAMIAALAGEFGIEIVEGTDYELRAALASGRLDLAITLQRPGEKAGETGAAVTTLLREAYAMIVPAGHRCVGAGPVAPEDLAAEVMIARRSCEILQDTSNFFTRRGVRPRFSLRSENDERCLRMVAAGLGITTAPVSFVIDGTVPISVTGYDFERTLALVGQAARIEDPAYAGLFDQVGGALAGALARAGTGGESGI